MLTKDNLINLLRFAEFTNLFAGVYRKTILNKDATFENNSQHSFQMAMIAWYICSDAKLDLDIEKLIKYALVHDLVEVYSGNFSAYDRDSEKQLTKDELERLASERIRSEFSEFEDLLGSLDSYNQREDRESKFIYALDKLLPIINIELNNNDFYFRTETTYEQMLAVKEKKIAEDPTIHAYFLLLNEYLTKDRRFFWPDCKDRDYTEKRYTF